MSEFSMREKKIGESQKIISFLCADELVMYPTNYLHSVSALEQRIEIGLCLFL